MSCDHNGEEKVECRARWSQSVKEKSFRDWIHGVIGPSFLELYTQIQNSLIENTIEKLKIIFLYTEELQMT